MKSCVLFLAIVSVLFLFNTSSAYVVSIHAPAVITNESRGTLTLITLNLTPGNGAITVTGPESVGFSTIASAREAVAVASAYMHVNASQYNFSFVIHDRNVSVSGPSAGLAFTLLSVAALEHEPLLTNFTVSGEILSNGSIGLIGGVYDKAMAAAQNHMRFFVLPNATPGGMLEQLIYYISQQIFNIPIVQVNNFTQALSYALGLSKPAPFVFNITQHYSLSQLPSLNLTCSSCNESAFNGLVNFTLNFTTNEINKIGSNFSFAKQQMLSNEQRYAGIYAKGYAYTAADFAFLQYLDAFTLANAKYTASGAYSALSNVSAYCSALTQPMLTTSNYEYVIGGELRQELANITLSEAYALLNNSSQVTSDSYIESLYYGAEALGWCKAAAYMYTLSSRLPGNYVSVSGKLQGVAASEIAKAEQFGNNLYLEAAIKSYDDGNYPAALYAATYAYILGNPKLSGNMTGGELFNATLSAINASYNKGIWPYQFSGEAMFYLNEYKLGHNDLQDAYSTAMLAKALAQDNREIASSFIISNVTGIEPALIQQLSNIGNELQQLFALMLVLLILIIALLILQVIQLLSTRYHKPRASTKARR